MATLTMPTLTTAILTTVTLSMAILIVAMPTMPILTMAMLTMPILAEALLTMALLTVCYGYTHYNNAYFFHTCYALCGNTYYCHPYYDNTYHGSDPRPCSIFTTGYYLLYFPLCASGTGMADAGYYYFTYYTY